MKHRCTGYSRQRIFRGTRRAQDGVEDYNGGGIAELRDQLKSVLEELTDKAHAIRDKTDAEMREQAEEFCFE